MTVRNAWTQNKVLMIMKAADTYSCHSALTRLRSISTSSSHQPFCLPSVPFPLNFPAKFLYRQAWERLEIHFLISLHACYMPRSCHPPGLKKWQTILLLVHQFSYVRNHGSKWKLRDQQHGPTGRLSSHGKNTRHTVSSCCVNALTRPVTSDIQWNL
jgi:hypothetical protein